MDPQREIFVVPRLPPSFVPREIIRQRTDSYMLENFSVLSSLYLRGFFRLLFYLEIKLKDRTRRRRKVVDVYRYTAQLSAAEKELQSS